MTSYCAPGRRPPPLLILAVLAVAGIAAFATVAALAGLAFFPPVVGFLLIPPTVAAMVLARRHTVLVLGLVTAAVAIASLVGGLPGALFVPVLPAAAIAVVRGHRIPAWIAAVTAYLAAFVAAPLLSEHRGLDPVVKGPSVVLAVVTVAVLLLAEAARGRRDHMIEQRRRRAGDERLRMARELHDVIAHNISLINVQAGVALHLMDDDPEQARTALTAIKAASRDTLREVRATLGVLRAVDEESPRAPAPSLDRLDELTGRLGAAGLAVEVVAIGQRRELPVDVDLAAYRIVQESLTNAHRHSGVAAARVELGYQPERLVVTVSDAGRGGEAVEGNGLAGMRERAAALGGAVTAGPGPEGGFTVRAELPLEPAA